MTQENSFVLIGAGLPRTGTMSTRLALQKLLKGNIYHMATLAGERPDHQIQWKKVLAGQNSPDSLKEMMCSYSGGVDYPVSLFYKELMEIYPQAKVLLSVRDPVKWYESVRNTIYRMNCTKCSWPVTWYAALTGKTDLFNIIRDVCSYSPAWSSQRLGMLGAVADGQKAAVQFYNDHVQEVESYVPADRLLIWSVNDGWGPLCEFLQVSVPNEPFPRVNDTAAMLTQMRRLKYLSWVFVVMLPASLVSSAIYFRLTNPFHYLAMAGGYFFSLHASDAVLRRFYKKHGGDKKKLIH